MSLYFKERVQEQDVADPENDKILFSIQMFAVIIPESYKIMTFENSFRTTYANHSIKWDFILSKNRLQVNGSHLAGDYLSRLFFMPHEIWKGSCNFTYKLYSGYEEPVKIYTSPQISALTLLESDMFKAPDGAIKEFDDAYDERKISFVDIFIELELPIKFFLRPFEMPSNSLSYKLCDEYPEDMKSDFRFEFLNESDFIFKCPDGNVPAMKMVLNVPSSFMKKYLKETKNDEIIVEHSLDVVKPINTFMHSGCFEMPTSYNLDFADRLLDAIELFELQNARIIRRTVYYTLCEKFVEGIPDFESLLKLLSFASQHSFYSLIHMISVEIASKYYYKWHHTSSDDEMNIITRLLFDSFISEEVAFWISREIEEIFKWSLLINVILP